LKLIRCGGQPSFLVLTTRTKKGRPSGGLSRSTQAEGSEWRNTFRNVEPHPRSFKIFRQCVFPGRRFRANARRLGAGDAVQGALSGRQVLLRDGGKAHWIRSRDRKSTRLNSSHVSISYAVFCLKKKKKNKEIK